MALLMQFFDARFLGVSLDVTLTIKFFFLQMADTHLRRCLKGVWYRDTSAKFTLFFLVYPPRSSSNPIIYTDAKP